MLHTSRSAGPTAELQAASAPSRHGDVGGRSSDKCRFWRYSGPGGRRAWLDEFRAPELLVGEVVAESLIEVLPGS